MKLKNTAAAVRGPLAAFALAAAISGLMASSAGAVQLQGMAAIATNRNCFVDTGTCPILGSTQVSSTIDGARAQQHQYFGGDGVSQLSVTPGLVNGASALVAGSFSAIDYLPTLHLASSAGPDTRTGMSFTSYRAFTWAGADIDLALKGNLHFITSGDAGAAGNGNEFPGDGQLNVSLGLLRVSTVAAAFPTGSDAITLISNSAVSFPDCGGDGVIGASGFNSAGLTGGEYNRTISLSQGCSGGAIRLQNGDTFVVIATMQAISNRSGVLDASHTFTVTVDEENTFLAGTTEAVGQNFVAANLSTDVAVPEPATWALMIGGFGLAGASLRRRRPRAA